MWYASPPEPCWTQSPKARWFFFLNLSAVDSSCAQVLGSGASFVFTSRPMFSTCTGIPYSFLTAVPYEKPASVYAGNCARTAFDGYSGSTRPLAASWPVQSFAARITSGAESADTVPTAVSIDPKSFVTTWTVAPFDAAQALATLVTAGARFASVQMTIVGPALCAATADDAITAAIAATPKSSAHMRLMCIRKPFLLGELRHGASWGQAPGASLVRACGNPQWADPADRGR